MSATGFPAAAKLALQACVLSHTAGKTVLEFVDVGRLDHPDAGGGPALDDLAVPVNGEPVMDGAGDGGADALDGGEFFGGGVGDGVHRARTVEQKPDVGATCDRLRDVRARRDGDRTPRVRIARPARRP